MSAPEAARGHLHVSRLRYRVQAITAYRIPPGNPPRKPVAEGHQRTDNLTPMLATTPSRSPYHSAIPTQCVRHLSRHRSTRLSPQTIRRANSSPRHRSHTFGRFSDSHHRPINRTIRIQAHCQYRGLYSAPLRTRYVRPALTLHRCVSRSPLGPASAVERVSTFPRFCL